jgi:hypothetical protein
MSPVMKMEVTALSKRTIGITDYNIMIFTKNRKIDCPVCVSILHN